MKTRIIYITFIVNCIFFNIASAQKTNKINIDLGLGINRFAPVMGDSLVHSTLTEDYITTYNLLSRLNINLSKSWTFQIGTNFIIEEQGLVSARRVNYQEKMKAQILSFKICNYLFDTSRKPLNVYWNLGVIYVNSKYSLKQISPTKMNVIENKSGYLPSVGWEGALGLRFNCNDLVDIFLETGMNKLDDKSRATVQGGISFGF